MKLSIIIPTLNEESVLEKTLESLRKLNAVDYEIIVSDGGSTDQTVPIAAKFADRIVENVSKTRQTIGQGRNAGAAVASGEYLVFLDADVDIPEINTFFLRAFEDFSNNPRLLGLSGWVRVFPATETWGDFFGYVIVSDCMFYLLNNIFRVGATCGEFQMAKAGVFRDIEGYREHLAVGEDKDLFYRLARLGRTQTDPKLLIYHTGRRPHKIGWPKLLWQWTVESLHVTVFDRSHSDEWKVIR
jgi:glycosyltransferase involved in cell wall biosynthesis